ncbi:MAG: hypothetical protein KKB90_05985 [Actinobacteria bacterium]|nr:hypothetical protein [Actinomycetota bacterium]MBU4218497.1 hypothetical protein [Actinomycetota bacterium]MBU4360147.1 hypothetical protein [Actinomycetota bacterium]MCG2819523.1 hypothetical protein [Actinomycetes bacterium]
MAIPRSVRGPSLFTFSRIRAIAVITAVVLLVSITTVARARGAERTEQAPREKRAERLPRATGLEAGGIQKDTWYLAEGSNNWGFHTWISIANPNYVHLTAKVTYMTEMGPIETYVNLTCRSQINIDTEEYVGQVDFSTRVECLEGLSIAADRMMTWGANEGMGSHCSIGVNEPECVWYLAEGCTAGGFETWVLVQNPNDVEAYVSIDYMTEYGLETGPWIEMAPFTRQTINVADTVADTYDVSTTVVSDQPVIAERAMYYNARMAGHDSVGVAQPSMRWYLAEGCTAGGFETWVLIQNPNDIEVLAAIDYLTDFGLVAGPLLSLPPYSRQTVNVADTVETYEVSTVVYADEPIIVERAMYGNSRAWGHDSIGMAEPHEAILLPSGTAGSGWETWTLVQNPNDHDVDVLIEYLTAPDAGVNPYLEAVIPANSRVSFSMGDIDWEGSYAPERRASVAVYCTSGDAIMAEQSIYYNYNGYKVAGSDTIGGYIELEQTE